MSSDTRKTTDKSQEREAQGTKQKEQQKLVSVMQRIQKQQGVTLFSPGIPSNGWCDRVWRR